MPTFPQHLFSGQPVNAVDSFSLFPNIPLLVSNLIKYHETMMTAPEFKDSKAIAQRPTIIDLKKVDDAKSSDTYTVVVAGFSYQFPDLNTRIAESLNSPISRYSFPVNKDLHDTLKYSIEDYELPKMTDSTYTSTNLQTFLSMSKIQWFKSFLSPMEEYAAIFEGSGTLSDCSPDGPSAAAYVSQYTALDANSEARKVPKTIYDVNAQFPLSSRLYTTQGSPQPETEILVGLTQIHCVLPKHHFAKTHYANASSQRKGSIRNGDVWNARPLYGPSNEIHVLDTVGSFATRFIKKQLL